MFSSVDFKELFDSFAGRRVLVVGDVMVDTYLWGKLEGDSGKTSPPSISGIIEENRLGGAANVALNIKALGAIPILCSVIGNDESGKLFLELIEEQGLGDIGLLIDEKRISTQKTRIIGGNDHLLNVDRGTEIYISGRIERSFLDLVTSLLENGQIDALILQDYDKGILSSIVIAELVRTAGILSVPVIADPCLNVPEQCGDIKHFKADFANQNREIVDKAGAGDTMISVAALCVAGGLNPGQITALSNLAGGQVCEKAGVVPVNAEKLLAECQQYLKSS